MGSREAFYTTITHLPSHLHSPNEKKQYIGEPPSHSPTLIRLYGGLKAISLLPLQTHFHAFLTISYLPSFHNQPLTLTVSCPKKKKIALTLGQILAWVWIESGSRKREREDQGEAAAAAAIDEAGTLSGDRLRLVGRDRMER